mgnify:FL=1
MNSREDPTLVNKVFEKAIADPDFLVRLATAIDGVVKEIYCDDESSKDGLS